MRRFHYAWVVAAVTWITLLAAAGFRSTPSTLIVPLQNEFGWSRATISVVGGCGSLSRMASSPAWRAVCVDCSAGRGRGPHLAAAASLG